MRVIVFVLRGCSAGWLGAYGNEWIITPNLDRLAAEGIVFDRHVSDCPEPVAACRAWLGSAGDAGLEGGSLLPLLRGAGVLTILVRASYPDTDAPDWFYAGWNEVFDARPQEEDGSPLDRLRESLPALLDRLASNPDFLLWIEIDRLIPPWEIRQELFRAYVGRDDEEEETEADPEEEVFEEGDELLPEEPNDVPEAVGDPEKIASAEVADALNDHTDEAEEQPPDPIEPVTPWSDPPTGPFDTKDVVAREWLQCSHGAVVTSLDVELEAVFDQLRTHALDRTATWLVTSDFGRPLGEHGQLGLHRPWLHEELVHLPLILRLPDGAEACRRVAAFTQPPDLPPTLLDLFAITVPTGAFDGSSVLPLARGEVESIRAHALTRLELGPAAELAIRTADWAYLLPTRVPEGETRTPQLFGKPDDRWEVSDLRSQHLELVEELEGVLRSVTKVDARPA